MEIAAGRYCYIARSRLLQMRAADWGQSSVLYLAAGLRSAEFLFVDYSRKSAACMRSA